MQTLLAAIPIAGLLLCLIAIKLPVTKSGGIAFGLALIIAVAFFGITVNGLLAASGKALWLALFVSLIVWCALLLYHLVSDFGGFDVINRNITLLVKDEFPAYLLLAWLFTGFLQGIAGFGIPSVIVTPILIARGIHPVKALCASLIGHSWTITFGSMAAGFYVIQNITGIAESELAFPMWMFNTITILFAGIGVSWVYGGFKGIAKGLPYVIPVWIIMAGVQFIITYLGIFSLATLLTALAGLLVMLGLYKLRCRNAKNADGNKAAALNEGADTPEPKTLSLLQATLPYAMILILLLLFQFIPASIRNGIALSFSFPATMTTQGFAVAAENNFNPIRIFVHPAMVMILASAVACFLYKQAGVWKADIFKAALKKTVKKGIPATLALLAFGHMSLIMMDSGMMFRLAKTVADSLGGLYPLAAPYIGVLGSFLTGNNTNSNVMFGKFQQTVAQELGLSEAVMASAQSIAGGLGCAIASTLVFMAALATKQTENVSVVLKKLIPIVLIIAGIMGIVNYIYI